MGQVSHLAIKSLLRSPSNYSSSKLEQGKPGDFNFQLFIFMLQKSFIKTFFKPCTACIRMASVLKCVECPCVKLLKRLLMSFTKSWEYKRLQTLTFLMYSFLLTRVYNLINFINNNMFSKSYWKCV